MRDSQESEHFWHNHKDRLYTRMIHYASSDTSTIGDLVTPNLWLCCTSRVPKPNWDSQVYKGMVLGINLQNYTSTALVSAANTSLHFVPYCLLRLLEPINIPVRNLLVQPKRKV